MSSVRPAGRCWSGAMIASARLAAMAGRNCFQR